MKRSGFSMIELVFVIVIMGILAAVAVPKMMGTSSKAKVAQCQNFYSGLSSSVSPILWMPMVQDNAKADQAYSEDNLSNVANISDDSEVVKLCAKGDVTKLVKIATEDGDNSFTITIENENDYEVNGTKASLNGAAVWTIKKK